MVGPNPNPNHNSLEVPTKEDDDHNKWISMEEDGLTNDGGVTGTTGPPLGIDITLGYMTGSSRKAGNLEYSRPGLTISGALTYALTDLRKSHYFEETGARVRFKLVVTETCGDEEESLRQVASLWKAHNVSVIIGPQETCLHEAKLAASLNIPMISYVRT